MVHRLLFAGIAWLALLSSGRTELIPPTDSDLRADYCLGVGAAKASIIDELRRALPDTPNVRMTLDSEAALNRSDGERLRAYLLPRVSYVDPTGLIAALNRAKRDAEEVSASSKKLQCPTEPAEALTACVETHSEESTAGKRMRQCKDLSWLPF